MHHSNTYYAGVSRIGKQPNFTLSEFDTRKSINKVSIN